MAREVRGQDFGLNSKEEKTFEIKNENNLTHLSLSLSMTCALRRFGFLTLSVCLLWIGSASVDSSAVGGDLDSHGAKERLEGSDSAAAVAAAAILDCVGYEWSRNLTGEPQRFSWTKNGRAVEVVEEDDEVAASSDRKWLPRQLENGSLALPGRKSSHIIISGIFNSHLVDEKNAKKSTVSDLYRCEVRGPKGVVVLNPIHVYRSVY